MQQINLLPWQSQSPLTPVLKGYLETFLALEKLSHEEKFKRSEQQLSIVLNHCLSTVPFYQSKLQGIEPQSITISEFSRLPILGKNDIRENQDALISLPFTQETNKSAMQAFHTSGSTGTPMKVFRGQRNILFTRALSLYYHLLHKRRFELCNVNIITCKESKLNAGFWATSLETGPGYTIDISENSETIFNHLLDLKPNYIQTHPSTLKRLIDLSLEKGRRLDSLMEVRTFGELLEPGIKQACLNHWGIPVSDNYSSEEMATMAFSCPYGDHYHVMDENVLIEIVDDEGKPCPTGKVGRILVTQLKNLAMPLLRYEIGDMGSKGEPGTCKLNLPILQNIEGRKRNLVSLPNGDTFHPVFDEEKILAIAPIKRYQLIQKSLQEIQVNILGKHLGEEKEQALAGVFSESFKGYFRFTFNYEDELPFSKRNKFELFKSEVELP